MEEEAWFTGVADELARCLVDAQNCAEACERLLEEARAFGDPSVQKRVVSALVPPAAVARVLIDFIEQPPDLVLAACRLCRESAQSALEVLEDLALPVDDGAALAALRSVAASCQLLIDAAS